MKIQISFILAILSVIINEIFCLKCKKPERMQSNSTEILKLEYIEIDCNEKCFHAFDADENNSMGCTSEVPASFQFMRQLKPTCLSAKKDDIKICTCDWNNCNILPKEILHAAVLGGPKVFNSSNNFLAYNLIVLLSSFLIYIFILMK
uniref:Protein quiver n=1 Tax=Parastrongyloides trichosuri TaxID=131310 RepID=A0A0N4Z341_PARTI